MTPDPYDDPFAPSFAAGAATEGRSDRPAPTPIPAERPVRKPSRPYGVQRAPAGLVRAPGAPMETLDPPQPPAAVAPPSPAAPVPTAPAPAATPFSAPAPAPAEPPAAARPPKPLRRRHEKFCIAYVMKGEASRAAWDAGYSGGSAHNQAYRLLKRPEIQARIAEIQRGLARGFAADAEALLGKLEAVYRHCIEAGRYNAAVRVVEVQARMGGHLKTKARQPLVAQNDEK